MIREKPFAILAFTFAFGFFTLLHLILGDSSYGFFHPFSSTRPRILMPKTPTMSTPITHVVLFQLKADAQPEDLKTAIEQMVALKDNCLHPKTRKPYILSLKGGKDNSPEGLQGGFTHGFVIEFASVQDRKYYVEKDPAHHAFIQDWVPKVVEKAVVVDFEDGVY